MAIYSHSRLQSKLSMEKNLKNKKVAILIADGFEESEFTQPL